MFCVVYRSKNSNHSNENRNADKENLNKASLSFSTSTNAFNVSLSSNKFYLPSYIENNLSGLTPNPKDPMNSPTSSILEILENKSPIPFEAPTPCNQSKGYNVNGNPQIIPNLQRKIDLTDTPELNLPEDKTDPKIKNDLSLLKELNEKYLNNPSIAYLNINSLRGNNKLELEEMLKAHKIDILCIDETKLSPDIPTSRIHINKYQFPPLRRDRPQKSPNSFGGGKVVYIREGLITKRLTELETKTAETICIELSLKSGKWFIMFGYRPESINRNIFFQEVNIALSKATNKYDNILFIGDLNIDLNEPSSDKENHLGNLYDIFSLSNLIRDKTCFMSHQGTSIDVILTNKPRSFLKSLPIETGLSDHHRLVITFLRSHIIYKLRAKNIM